jgi:phage terminase large subunit
MNPYPHQREFLRAVSANKNACIVVHRRAGKDLSCLQAWLMRALQRVGTHVYLFPLFSQARSVIWSGMDYDGKPFISAIPDCLILKKNDARMTIELFNGSRLILAGSNNFDSLMGTNPVTIIYSEFSLHNPLARQYLNPIIIQNDGREYLQFTPRGMGHSWEVFNTLKENPEYLIQHLSVEQTFKHDGNRIITAEDIKRAKDLGMSEEMIRQEFYVDFTVGNMGAYYTREMADMEREGRIMPLKPDPRLKLHSIFDLGSTDATAGLLFQVTGKYIHVLYLLHNTGKGFKYYLDEAEKVRQSMGLEWGQHFGPHDIDQKHQGFEHTESRLVQARRYGWHFNMVPKVNLDDGIESVRYMFPRLRIDKHNCSLAIRALREYQRLWDEKRACFDPKPLDNWATHIADAFRYLAVQYKRLYDIPMVQSTYDTTM